MAGMIINDSVWGPIELPEVCRLIINTPEFQRLRYIKQLGGAYFVYPGACHNRFEHSIGTSYLAGKLGLELQKNQEDLGIDEKDILCLQVAGLCHDLGHGAFSHLFDRDFMEKVPVPVGEKKWKHEDASRDMVDRIYKNLKGKLKKLKPVLTEDDIRFIQELIKPENTDTQRGDRAFIYEIVSNDVNKIDVDKWDYFARDCHMLGLHHNFQVERSIKLARVVQHGENQHISFPKSEYLNIFDMFFTRYTLHRKAYQHPVTRAVETMIADALLKADKYLSFPTNKTKGKGCEPKTLTLSQSVWDMDAYIWVTDDVFHQIRTLSCDKANGAQEILNRILTRDLYRLIGEKRIEIVTKREVDVKKWMEKTLRESLAKEDKDMYEIQELVLNYGDKDKNPMDNVKFYMGKEEPYVPYVYKKEEMSLMMPKTFEQKYLQLFWKGSRDQKAKLKKKIAETFMKIQEYREGGEVLVKFFNTVDTCED